MASSGSLLYRVGSAVSSSGHCAILVDGAWCADRRATADQRRRATQDGGFAPETGLNGRQRGQRTWARNRHSTGFRAAKAQAGRRSVGKELLICSPGTQLLTNRKRGIVGYFSGGTFGTFEYHRHDLLCGGQPFAIQGISGALPPATLNHRSGGFLRILLQGHGWRFRIVRRTD